MPRTCIKVSRHARLMRSAAQRLEKHKTLLALTMSEHPAVDFVSEYRALHPRTNKLPRVFTWRGARYWLEYTTLGRVYVRVTGSKVRFPSASIAI